ncbi:MAG: CDP-alcohol phosphatidyltransferase family protein [Proteobacteria bacterium]|nr:CDP-alcohol phosphatidyltransferase family protein [Pseudomonadota bacterium]MBU2226556.1 CDP-alcohol phosphatidyltransferase family protein [Pseudomonadota bacterium]MBU2262841.1 CDP-alcohol phosphatidyltransferase family protein [Pseudomonadota bacterium]
MNIPNILTLLRILMVPVIVILLIQESFLKALIVFMAAGLTDILDGFLARVLHQQTVLGSYLDPIADKALLVSSFVTLSVLHVIPGWLAVLVISRDLFILLGISVLSIMSISVEIRPAFVSKVTTALQLITVLLSLSALCLPGGIREIWLLPLYWVTAFFTIVSGLNYMARGMKIINNDAKK